MLRRFLIETVETQIPSGKKIFFGSKDKESEKASSKQNENYFDKHDWQIKAF